MNLFLCTQIKAMVQELTLEQYGNIITFTDKYFELYICLAKLIISL